MNILLACNGGVSTGLIADKIENYAKENGMDVKAWAVDYGQVTEEVENEKVDVILIGPQISYKLKSLQNDLKGRNIKIATMGFSDYGTMNVANIIKTAQKLMEENNG